MWQNPLTAVSSLPLLVGDSRRSIRGGPYFAKPGGYYGIKLAQEIDLPYGFDLPIRDFGLPKDRARLRRGLAIALDRVARGLPTYVGCRGGLGRTGLFLALLAKLTGVLDPVAYVRRFYNENAVETEEQEEFVSLFDPRSLSFDVWKAKGTAALVDFSCNIRTYPVAGSTLTQSVNMV